VREVLFPVHSFYVHIEGRAPPSEAQIAAALVSAFKLDRAAVYVEVAESESDEHDDDDGDDHVHGEHCDHAHTEQHDSGHSHAHDGSSGHSHSHTH
jgi:hypothetical protein